ncbi:hypothetical protein Mbo2_006 [Rhodococcus phage Mbo2]|uniref:Uncharacterized protein n=1 Tax=Rhodococcus phage Mbo2 TaxID=2936911 RepID=A0A9E7IM95_9CAUD|nr:hypothetical protein Mbo2_006 [Rhodococcus phage Mbo2]
MSAIGQDQPNRLLPLAWWTVAGFWRMWRPW